MKFTQSFLHENDFYQDRYRKKQKKVNFMMEQSDDQSINKQNMMIDDGQSQHDFYQKSKRKTTHQQYSLGYQESEKSQNGNRQLKSKKSSSISSIVLIRSLFSYIKKVKVLPTILVEQLQKRERKYDTQNPLIYYPFGPKDKNFSVKTRQGQEGVRQLIHYLENLQSKQSDGLAKEVQVQWSHELHMAASMRVNAIQKGNSHTQSLDIGELVNQYASWKGPLYEIVVYGFFDPKQILIEAFLQDDSANKNNRNQFFNEGGKYVGIDMGHHDKYQIVTVMIFAGGVGKIQNKKNKSYRSMDGSINEECQCKIC